MRSFLRATLDCFIRDEPGVAAAAPILSLGVSPARDVALVGIRDTKSEPIDRRPAFGREMKDVFMAIVEITR